MEIFHWVFVKDNKVVAHEAITAGLVHTLANPLFIAWSEKGEIENANVSGFIVGRVYPNGELHTVFARAKSKDDTTATIWSQYPRHYEDKYVSEVLWTRPPENKATQPAETEVGREGGDTPRGARTPVPNQAPTEAAGSGSATTPLSQINGTARAFKTHPYKLGAPGATQSRRESVL